MKYPILYKSNETDFFTMGLGPIEMLKATVTQERNGIFVFEGEILTDNPLFPLVLENCIIKADADHLLKDQRFRIKRIVPNHNGKAEIYAEHVSYLSRELTIKPEVNITGSAQVALNQWKSSIVESNPFVVSSDITTSASTKWRIDKVSNPMMALGGVEGSILDRWGGEYLFDNYHISLLKKRGKTATNILAYGRNITDFEQERNILSTYTSVAPYAIYTDDREREVIITVDGYVVDSEHINKYPNRVTKPIDFSSEFGHDETPTKARLTTLAQQYIADNEIGVPTTSIKISFLDLSQTADYADYAFLEQVNLCDDVRVHYPKLGVNTIAKVVRVVWNCLTESYDEIEIGQKRMSLASQIQEQNKVIQEINTQTNHAQVSADGKNMIFYGLYGENGLGQPTATKIGDTWFKPSGLETEMLIWTGVVWTNPFLGGDNIADEAITGTKIANATIGSAKIINIDASKITTGTISAINYQNPFTFWYGDKQFSGETTISNGGINQYGTASDGTQVSLTLTGGGLKTQYGTGSTNLSPARIEFVAQDGTESLLHYSDSESVLYISSYVGGGLGAYRKRNGVEEFRGLLKTETDWADYNAIVIRGNLKANDINFPNGSFIYDNASKDLFVSAPRHLYLRTNGVNVIDLDPITSQIRTYLDIDMNYRNLWNVANITQTSDERLKTNITPTSKNGIEWTMKQRVVDYNWDGSNSVNRNKPTTKQFGIIAQNAGEFSIVNEQTGYLSVSSLDLINIGIKTDQEIIKKMQDHEKEISALKITMNFDIWQLKNEIAELKNEINSLRQAVV